MNNKKKYLFSLKSIPPIMFEEDEEVKTCVLCRKELKGRADKKFCDDYCRSAYNNSIKSKKNNLIRNVNNALSKNRRILEKLLPENEGMKKVKKSKLSYHGFQFQYCTHTYTNKKGDIYYFCYDYGYLLLDKEMVLLVKRDEK